MHRSQAKFCIEFRGAHILAALAYHLVAAVAPVLAFAVAGLLAGYLYVHTAEAASLVGSHVHTFGPGMEVIGGQVTAPGSTFTAWTMNAGNSLTIRNCPSDKKVFLLQAWADNQTAGGLRVRSPKLHDNVQGIRFRINASEVDPLIPMGFKQQLYPQDTLIVEHSGSATAGDIEAGALLIHYEDLPGQSGRFISYDDLVKKGTNVVTVENTISTGTAGGFSGSEAINSEFDLLKANTDYALVGYLTDTECATVRWMGVDVGNLGVGGLGNDTDRQMTQDWFARLSKAYALPLIPVFNSANKAAILLDVHIDENGADPAVTSIFVELGPNPTAR